MKGILGMILSIIFLLNISLAYTVTVKVNGMGLRSTINAGETVGVEATNPDITGWEIKTGNTTITDNQFTMPEGNVEIEGILTESKYLLKIEYPTFTKIEGKTEGVSVTVEANETAGEKTFSGWTATGITLTGEQQVNRTITFTMPGNAVTLVANYTEIIEATYTISYNANGGSGEPESQTKTQGVDLTLSSTEPTKEGYNFLGWSISSSATSVEYTPGGNFTIDSDTTLYAVWEEASISPYTITSIQEEGIEIEGEYSSYRCSVCGGRDHQCEVVNIMIDAGNAIVIEI